MMTTMAALVGTLPIALGWGAGAESRRPLGLAVVGGLLVSQLLTLYITPVYYVYIEQARKWLVRKRVPGAARRAANGLRDAGRGGTSAGINKPRKHEKPATKARNDRSREIG